MVKETADHEGLSLDKFLNRGKRTRSKSKKPAHFLQKDAKGKTPLKPQKKWDKNVAKYLKLKHKARAQEDKGDLEAVEPSQDTETQSFHGEEDAELQEQKRARAGQNVAAKTDKKKYGFNALIASKAEEQKKLAAEKRTEIQRMNEERAKAIAKAGKIRKSKQVVHRKKTPKGQPLMRDRLKGLLNKIEAEMA